VREDTVCIAVKVKVNLFLSYDQYSLNHFYLNFKWTYSAVAGTLSAATGGAVAGSRSTARHDD
jgi:hypothetical protein